MGRIKKFFEIFGKLVLDLLEIIVEVFAALDD